jgi:hypothetical protein
MKRATAELGRRVSRLEAGRSSGPLTKTEARELAVLQAEHDARFAGPINGWSDELLKEFIHDQCAAAGRLDELRERNAGPEQTAADRVRLCQVLDVTAAELDVVLADAVAQLCRD